jgi:tetratricopeptide (TPR) repeat protein
MLNARYISFVLLNGPAMKKVFSTLLLLIFFNGLSYAADSAPTVSEPGWLTESRASIKAKKYELAIEQLKSANASSSADWNNLLGYSLRKKQPPDLAGAEIYYEAALKIDPKHRGALEYYGELKLMKNDLPGAEALLARLDKACTFGCEEYTDLKQAVQKFKSQMRR